MLFTLGDPQATLEDFLDALRAAGALAPDDQLRPDAAFLSMGDHFDFAPPPGWTLAQVGQQGIAILDWIAAQPADRALALLGNHDAARVMELHRLSDAAFAEARRLAPSLDEATFAAHFPDIPTADIAARDFSSFSEAQRRAVQQALLSGRLRLAAAVRTRAGHVALATHAAVTARELDLLGLPPDSPPQRIAAALNAHLDTALAAVRPAWLRGEPAPLSLAPLHLPGQTGAEGGGLLYHRPETRPLDAWAQTGRRRFHPGELPRGLLQLCGHTHHRKCRELMPDTAGRLAPEAVGGRLRSLCVSLSGAVHYQVGLAAPDPAQATLWLTDGQLHHHGARTEVLVLESLAEVQALAEVQT